MEPEYSSPNSFSDIRLVKVLVISEKQTKNNEKNSSKSLSLILKLMGSDFLSSLTIFFAGIRCIKFVKMNRNPKINTKVVMLVMTSIWELDREVPLGSRFIQIHL